MALPFRLKQFQGDLIAGLTVGLTVIPQGLAYAQIAELPPQVKTSHGHSKHHIILQSDILSTNVAISICIRGTKTVHLNLKFV